MRLALAALVLALGCGYAQAQKVPRIGWLSAAASPAQFPESHALEGLRELGWIDGKTIHIEFRHTSGDTDRLSASAADLAQRRPELIVTFSAGVPVAKKVTNTVPVVFGTSQDPVGAGYVASLSRPGGNMTGVTYLTDELSAKRLELIKDTVRGASRVAVIWERNHVDNEYNGMAAAGPSLGLRIQSIEVPRPPRSDEVERVVQSASQGRADAIVLAPGAFTIANRRRIAELAARNKIPVVSAWSIFAEEGALLTYGPNLQEISRRIAVHIDKVLKGARPETLPVETPRKFELVVNRRAAAALGVTIPEQVLQRADRVIN